MKTAFILQPSLYDHHESVLSEEEKNIFEAIYLKDDSAECRKQYAKANMFYRKIKCNAVMEGIIDYTDIFNGQTGMYLDEIHYSREGNRMLAEAVFRFLEKWEAGE